MMNDDTNVVITDQPHEEPSMLYEQQTVSNNNEEGLTGGSMKSEGESEEEGPTSSIENIIPIDKLKKGWFAVSGLLSNAASKVQVSAMEAYNSETAQQMRKKTSETIEPAWQKTVEVTTPIWEQTKQTAAVAFEKTKEGMNTAAEQMKPTLEKVSTYYFYLSFIIYRFALGWS
jgi:hypothetical protein